MQKVRVEEIDLDHPEVIEENENLQGGIIKRGHRNQMSHHPKSEEHQAIRTAFEDDERFPEEEFDDIY